MLPLFFFSWDLANWLFVSEILKLKKITSELPGRNSPCRGPMAYSLAQKETFSSMLSVTETKSSYKKCMNFLQQQNYSPNFRKENLQISSFGLLLRGNEFILHIFFASKFPFINIFFLHLALSRDNKFLASIFKLCCLI